MDERRVARYWAKVDRRGDDECWPWTAFRNQFDYGMFNGGGVEQLAHRFGYRLAYDDLADGMIVCHHCDNPCCQNPRHMYAGTPATNAADKSRRGRVVVSPMPGERNSQARLTETEVGEIRSAYALGETQTSLAARYGVGQTQIGRIVRARQWVGAEPIDGSRRRATRGTGHPNAKLTEADVLAIRELYAAGGISQREIGERYGVTQASISSVIRA